jgi:hypothetical protein
MKNYAAIIASLEDLDGAEQAIQDSLTLLTRLGLFQNIIGNWHKAEEGVKKAQQELEKVDLRARTLADEYGDLLQNAGRCPTCFAEINQDTIARIRREIL